MLTLGIHDGHTATACLFEDGEVISCISEERLNRQKEWSGFPTLAIKKCLETTGKGPDDISAVGVCSIMPQIGTKSYYNPHGYKKVFAHVVKVLPERLLQKSGNIRLVHAIGKGLFHSRVSEISSSLADMGIETRNIFFYEHHRLHAITAYYTNWHRSEKTLVLTLDGSGDAVCASVSVGEGGMLKRNGAVFNYNSICDFYTRVTQYLGMKPMSHEYKVMGMAPYASASGRREVLEIFRRYFRISGQNPLLFLNTSGLWKWQFTDELRKVLAGKRFDLIAGAVQDLFEEIVLEWVRSAVRISGVGDLALSGGGFMNVKLNYLISRLPEVESLFIFPSCGDESNPVGAAMQAALDIGFDPEGIKPLGMVFWGPSYGEEEIERAVQDRFANSGFRVRRHENISEAVAGKIAEGKIVGRFSGRMEWGARALGNRSILADPRDPRVIHEINRAIKMRDFWMPFAPAVLREYRDTYLELRDDMRCLFMTVAPDTKKAAWEDIPAGLHPFDKSARAQVVDPVNHPAFYDTVSAFERITGVGGVLNTSFNIHGDPIVCSPEDAIKTFLESGIDLLQLEDYLIEK